MLLPALVNIGWPRGVSLTELMAVGSVNLYAAGSTAAGHQQATLFD